MGKGYLEEHQILSRPAESDSPLEAHFKRVVRPRETTSLGDWLANAEGVSAGGFWGTVDVTDYYFNWSECVRANRIAGPLPLKRYSLAALEVATSAMEALSPKLFRSLHDALEVSQAYIRRPSDSALDAVFVAADRAFQEFLGGSARRYMPAFVGEYAEVVCNAAYSAARCGCPLFRDEIDAASHGQLARYAKHLRASDFEAYQHKRAFYETKGIYGTVEFAKQAVSTAFLPYMSSGLAGEESILDHHVAIVTKHLDIPWTEDSPSDFAEGPWDLELEGGVPEARVMVLAY